MLIGRPAGGVTPSRRTALLGGRARCLSAEPLGLPTKVEGGGWGQARQGIDDRVEVVFVCGGDGTVMACASELAGTDVALAVLPSGTGNLLATNLLLPANVAAGVAVAVGG